jgi:hypothetical protein
MGAQRRQHHRREAAKRQAGIDATAMRIAQEEARRRQQQEIDRMRGLGVVLSKACLVDLPHFVSPLTSVVAPVVVLTLVN